jgi:hypothetical protein
MKTITIFILCLAGNLLQAQTVTNQTLRWNASGFKDLNSGEVVNATSQFITYGQQKVEWVQGNGSFTSTFTITSVAGSWTNVSNKGSIVYNISGNQLTGQLTFARTTTGVTIQLTFTSGTTSPIKHSYTITSIDTL